MHMMLKASGNITKIENYMAGMRAPASTGREHDIFNPATGEVTAHVGYSNASDVDAAVSAAKRAFPAWADTPSILRRRSASISKGAELSMPVAK